MFFVKIHVQRDSDRSKNLTISSSSEKSKSKIPFTLLSRPSSRKKWNNSQIHISRDCPDPELNSSRAQL